MEPDKINRPGHMSFIFLTGSFLSIFGLLVFILLTLPLYYYALFGLIVFLVKKFYLDKDLTSSVFIKCHDKANICVVGAGFSGLAMGVKLKKAGIKFRILEKESEVGGTWVANQYPGCRCDVWSVLYQVSFEIKCIEIT